MTEWISPDGSLRVATQMISGQDKQVDNILGSEDSDGSNGINGWINNGRNEMPRNQQQGWRLPSVAFLSIILPVNKNPSRN